MWHLAVLEASVGGSPHQCWEQSKRVSGPKLMPSDLGEVCTCIGSHSDPALCGLLEVLDPYEASVLCIFFITPGAGPAHVLS